MMKTTVDIHRVHAGSAARRLRRLRSLAGIVIAFAGSVFAADTAGSDRNAKKIPTADEVVSLQNFVVTGSNIKRLDMEKVAPVTVIDQDAMAARQALLPVDMLTSLPSVVNLPENETRLGSSGARGDNANINLRNLGATGTLILVNGRRMAINPMTAGLSFRRGFGALAAWQPRGDRRRQPHRRRPADRVGRLRLQSGGEPEPAGRPHLVARSHEAVLRCWAAMVWEQGGSLTRPFAR